MCGWALGTMLEIGPNGPERLPTDHPMAGHLDVYQWLTVLQEYLVLGLMDKTLSAITDVGGYASATTSGSIPTRRSAPAGPAAPPSC